jgi:DNA-binding Lrp family transcriptional regulator
MHVVVDELDIKILREYLRDARLSCREVARRLHTSVKTVLIRLRELEKEGVVKGYSVILDYEKLGFNITAITEVTVSKGRLLEMEEQISTSPHTIAIYDVTGEIDAIVISKFKNMDDLNMFTKWMLKLPYIERTNTHVVLTLIKEDLGMDPQIKETVTVDINRYLESLTVGD